MESADRESRRLDILSVKKEANLSAREVVSQFLSANEIFSPLTDW